MLVKYGCIVRLVVACTQPRELFRCRAMFWSARSRIEKVDFVIAGAQKCGTTALHYYLSKHPRIAFPKKQELHFFDRDELFAGEPDYRPLHESFEPTDRSSIPGECTPVYLFWEPCMERIRRYNAAMKLLIVLRNPAERAFSHWNMQRERGYEPLDFPDAIAAESSRTVEAQPLQLRKFSYLARGFYAVQLERVFRLFPREQVHVIKFESWRNAPAETVRDVFRFLELEPTAPAVDKEKNSMPYARKMTSEERARLVDIFRDDIARTEQLLGWNCADWRRVTPAA